ncbi:MAG: M14 family zinc carboxypeptidase [Spirosomataceae bacterium]
MKRLFIQFLALFLSIGAFAQVADSYYLPQNVTYDPKIPTPKQFLGYQVGEQHVTPYEQYAYWRELAKLTNRFKVEVYGKSFENRELLLITVTSPQNHTNLEKLKAEHKKLTIGSQSSGLDTKNMPIVVWQGYSVHGNEASGTNSALLTAYYLAAAQGPAIDSLLNEAIILVDPCINPDGGNRFSTWVNINRSTNLVSDANNREFSETWPGGRTNHYWFDLNRDWLYQQMPESKGRLVKFYDWKPNILTDHHEMGSGSTFFFQPGIPSRTHPMTPKKNIELTAKIGNYHAEGLDKIGSFYYTQENYDDYYYGKGSTLPDVNGSIGILFEQASSRGHLQETQNGLLSFPFTIRNQFSATLSTLKAAKEMRVELLNYMRDFYKETSSDPIKAYVFGGGNDPIKTWEMVNIMKRNEIDVYRLSKDESIDGKSFSKANSFVIPMNQAQHRLIKATFEKRTTFEDSLFYDISAWTMPLCMNVPYAEAKTAISLGDKIEQNDFPKGKVIGKSTYAYLFTWDSYFAPRAAYELMKKGYGLKVATEPFTAIIGGKEQKFDYGTIQIICNGNDPNALLQTLAERDGIDFFASPTGLTPVGIDFGSENFKRVRQPRPLMIVGTGVDSNDAGEIWHLLDQRINIPLVTVDIETVNRINLDKYTHILMVSGNYGNLSEDKIRRFVAGGGTLVAMNTSVEWAASKKIANVTLKSGDSETKEKRPYVLASKYSGALATAGTIFEAKIDPTHPICYGYKQDKIALFKDNNIFMEDTKDPYNTPLIFTPNPLMAGYIHPKNEKLIKNSPAVIAHTSGAGRVISMTENHNFRAFWYGTNKLFLNTLFFSNIIGGGRFGGED